MAPADDMRSASPHHRTSRPHNVTSRAIHSSLDLYGRCDQERVGVCAKRVRAALRGLLAPRAFVERYKNMFADPAAIDALLAEQETNALENYHMGIEQSFATMLRQLQAGDISFYSNDKDCIDFAHYIAIQYMRTKGIKVRMEEAFKQHMNIDITRLWNIASVMQATNIGCSLFLGRKRQRLVLLKNGTAMPFVTGDQPIINLHGGNRPKPPTMLSMYYPLSPGMAMIWGDVDELVPYSSDTLTAEQVSYLNARIANEAHAQVFGHSATSLQRLTVS